MTPNGNRFRIPLSRNHDRVAEDVDAELAFHLEMVAQELEAQGWTKADAEREARRRFGDLDETRRYCGDQDIKRQKERNRMAYLTELAQDVRYTLRSLLRSPGFSLVVLLTLALGIGANTAIFSVVRAVLLQPLPFREPDRLVRVWHENPSAGVAQGLISEPDFLDWRRESKVAESMGAFFHMDGLSGVDLTGDGPPARLASTLVAEGFFETLGAQALYGRTLNAEDQLVGRQHVAVLGYGLWRTRFNGDEAIVGRSIMLNGVSFQVVGVMPEHFSYPADRGLDVWLPLSFAGADQIGRGRRAAFQGVVARLKPGATPEQLAGELGGIATRLAQQYPENRGWESVKVLDLRESIVGNLSRPLALTLGAVLLVLLITCANVASLLLARATSRQRELAVRAALGAGRARIARQLLTESLVLAFGGGLLGATLAFWAVQGIARAGVDIPRAALVQVDGTVLLFTLGITLFAGALFGVLPALRATGDSLDGALRSGTRGSVGAGLRLRSALVVGQVALAVVLVTAAALTTKSFAKLLAVDLGFRPENALFVEMSVGDRYATSGAKRAYYESVLDAIRNTPGVLSVGAIRDLPTRGRGETGPISVAGVADDPNASTVVQYHQVSHGFFTAMQTPLKRGRLFTAQDREDAPLVVIINEELARRAFPGEDPTTRALRFGTQEIRIVGVVGDIRQGGAAEPIEPAVYLHVQQSFRSRMSIVVRTGGDPLALANSVRQAIWNVDAQQTITTLAPLEEILGDSVARPRLLASLFAMFGVLGLALGALGIYGLLAFNVNQRVREIGVRLALGATPGDVRVMFVKQGLVLASAGLAIGIVGALAATGVIEAVLYGFEAIDSLTLAQVALAVAATAVVASWIPARRATTVDPAVTLRTD